MGRSASAHGYTYRPNRRPTWACSWLALTGSCCRRVNAEYGCRSTTLGRSVLDASTGHWFTGSQPVRGSRGPVRVRGGPMRIRRRHLSRLAVVGGFCAVLIVVLAIVESTAAAVIPVSAALAQPSRLTSTTATGSSTTTTTSATTTSTTTTSTTTTSSTSISSTPTTTTTPSAGPAAPPTFYCGGEPCASPRSSGSQLPSPPQWVTTPDAAGCLISLGALDLLGDFQQVAEQMDDLAQTGGLADPEYWLVQLRSYGRSLTLPELDL